MDIQACKRRAGRHAADEFLRSGMTIGLGTGSTAIFATRRIAERLQDGSLHDIAALPTSIATEAAARELGIPLTTFAERPLVDVTIDGADEVDDDLNVIKGGGGALLREKIVAQATRRFVIVVDETKRSPCLGSQYQLPVEVTPFGWQSQAGYLRQLGAAPTLRLAAGAPYRSDQGNFILDCDFGAIRNLAELNRALNSRAGIVEHGLFLGMAHAVVVAGHDGLRLLRRAD